MLHPWRSLHVSIALVLTRIDLLKMLLQSLMSRGGHAVDLVQARYTMKVTKFIILFMFIIGGLRHYSLIEIVIMQL